VPQLLRMEALLEGWDGEAVVVRHDKASGAWMFIAIHSTRLGPAAGGTRMKSYPDVPAALRDALRLGEGMTYKFAASGLPFGGAKAVIAVPGNLDPQSRAPLLRRYGTLVKQLGGLFRTGPDVGTAPADMDVISTTGAPYILSRTAETGGAGDPGPFTARGVFTGIELACERLFGETSVKRRTILVQGAGDVGGSLIRLLREAGAEVLFSEVNDALVRVFRDELGLRHVDAAAVYSTECDIFSPCALGGVLNASTIPQLRCRAVAGSANNQLEDPEDAESLHSRGILYAPDYVINAGGAIAVLGIELERWSPDKAEDEVVNSVRRNLGQLFESAASGGITTEVAARRLAETRLHAAT
jgi:leucine dehydrogenase